MRFEEVSRPKRIGEYPFFNCRLTSIKIQASVEEINGSTFVGCPLLVIEIAAGRQNFKIPGGVLPTSDGTTIVRYFAPGPEVIVPTTLEVLGRSSFE
jgi:hypothetical protein